LPVEPTDLLRQVSSAFERLGTEYAVVGSMASSYYGEPRLTNDVDVIAVLRLDHVTQLLEAFPATDFYVRESAVRQAVANLGQFNIIHPDSGLKVDVVIAKPSEFDRTRLNRRIRVQPGGTDVDVYFASPEDVILKKMEYYREGGSDKHLRDIAGMLKIRGDKIDRSYIEMWAPKLGVDEIWDLILSQL